MVRTAAAIRRAAKALLISVGLTAVSAGSYFGYLHYEGNVHVVDKNKFYRSSQLDKAEFAAVIKRYGIKTILNLRGRNAGQPWYDNEIAVSRQFDVAHYDYPISATRAVGRDQIEAIMRIVRAAPKPILVHCQAGADRAGLVSALYSFIIEGKSAADADRQLSLAYGHFPYLMSRSKAMDESFWAYAAERPAQPSGVVRAQDQHR